MFFISLLKLLIFTDMISEYTRLNTVVTIATAFVYFYTFLLVSEPIRQRLNAVIIVGEGAVHLSRGLWQFCVYKAPTFYHLFNKKITD